MALEGLKSIDIQFFVEFPAESLSVSFRRMALATRKLPVAGQMGAWGAQSQQESVVAFDDGRDEGGTWFNASGDARHSDQ